MFKIKYGIYIALIGLLVTVSYANTNSVDSSTPLGVVTKGEQRVAAEASPADQAVTPEVPGIPQEMPAELLEASLNSEQSQEPETAIHVVTAGSADSKARKTAKNVSSGLFTMPSH